MPDEIDNFLDERLAAEEPKDDIDSFLDQRLAAPRPRPKPVAAEPSTLEQWTGHGTFIHSLGDAATRLGSAAQNVVSAGGNALAGDLDTAGKRLGSAVKGLPGMVGAVADTVGGRFGAPSAADAIDEAVGFEEKDRMHGQKLLKEVGLLSRDDNPLVSLPGLAGFVLDATVDPLNKFSGGLTKAGKEAAKVSGAKKFVKGLETAAADATATGNTTRMRQLVDLHNSHPELAKGTELAATKAKQVDAGQRALVQFGDTPLIKGKAVYEGMDKIDAFLDKHLPSLRHGPITEHTANVAAMTDQRRDEFDKARKAMQEMSNVSDPAKQAELGKVVAEWHRRWNPTNSVTPDDFAKSALNTFSPGAKHTAEQLINALEGRGAAPGVAHDYIRATREMFDTYKDIEHRLEWGNVGSDALQMTPENKSVLSKFNGREHIDSVDAFASEVNDRLMSRGIPKAFNAQGGLREMIDDVYRTGAFTVNELNEMLDTAGIKREPGWKQAIGWNKKDEGRGLFSTDVRDITYMRGSQHVRAQGTREYINGLLQNRIGSLNGNSLYKFPERLGDGMRGTTVYFQDATQAVLAKRSMELMLDPEYVPFVDSFNKAMKAGVTKLFPDFHVRNTLSNRIQSKLEGVPFTGPHRSLAADIMAGKNVSVEIGGKTYDRDALLRLYLESGASKGGFWEAAVAEAEPMGAKPGPTKKAFQTVTNAAEHVTASPAGVVTGQFNPKVLAKMTGSMVEDTDRLAHWIYKVKDEGLDIMSARDSVNRALFNYSPDAQTPFERQVLNRAFLFYGYQRNIMPYIAQKALEKPGHIANLVKLGTSGGRPEDMPGYAEEQQTMGLPNNFDEFIHGGAPRKDAVATALPSPLGAALEPLADLDKGLGATARGLLNRATPLGKLPIEIGTGQKLLTGTPATNKPPKLLEKLGVQGVSPELNTVMDNLPTSRGVRTLGSEANTDLLSKLAGVGVSRFTPDAQRWFDKQKELEPQVKEFYAKGWLTKSGSKYYPVKKPGVKVPRRAARIALLYNVYGQNGAALSRQANTKQ
jgi:hypothetical protein